MRRIFTCALVILLLTGLVATIPTFITACETESDSGWILTKDAGAVKAYPNLREYVWQKNAIMPPNGEYDKIGLHRLVSTTAELKGVIFMTNCPMWGVGEQRITNPPNDNWTKCENYSQAIYWANRGFDVYAIDYRPHFVPKTLNASQMSFVAEWGWDVWVSDIKEAAEKVKEVSGCDKFFMSGECTGAQAALNYATKYGGDLQGIIMIDANYPPIAGYPVVGTMKETNTYNLSKVLSDMNSVKNWTNDAFAGLRSLAKYALQNPGAPAMNPNGSALNPPVNPMTNKTWTNITEWFSFAIYNNFGSAAAMPKGMYSNTVGGYGNVSQNLYSFANSEFIPFRIFAETMAMADWVNCPYVEYDYNDHYKEINVPILAFASGLYSNRTGTFQFVNGTANPDCTGIYLPKYGHTDAFFGTYSARDVSEPAYQWMLNHSPSSWKLTTANDVKRYPDLKEYVWQKNAAMSPHGPYDKIGLHRLVNPSVTPKGVVFICPGTYQNGAQFTSNPSSDKYTKTENDAIAYYWANRGFDVYSIDYRTHNIPITANMSQLGFMANWGWDQWISDIKEAVEKTKEVSGANKVFMAGFSFGGMATMNYASKYWREDLQGMILLDGGWSNKCTNGTSTFNLTTVISGLSASGAWALEFPNLPGMQALPSGVALMIQYIYQNPGAAAEFPPGKPLQPPINPITNKTWTNITEWNSVVNNGQFSNMLGGYGNVTVNIRQNAGSDRYWPARIWSEMMAYRDWTSCPYLQYDYDEHYKEINVPVLGFQSELFGIPRFEYLTNGVACSDFTTITLPKYGHSDVISGIYASKDVFEPAYQWMLNHLGPRDVFASTAHSMTLYCTSPKLVILDVRDQSEFNTGYVSGAISIPVWQLQQRIGELAQYKDSPILVYCGTGVRSQKACQTLTANGFTQVYNMIGGVNAWKNSGYPIATPKC